MVLVSLRSDGSTKLGGDVSLLRSFADELAVHHRVEIVVGVPSAAEIGRHDLVLAANLDRPIEPAATLARAERAGIPMVLYALHHPAAGVTAYLQHGATGVRRQLGRLAGGSPTRYEQLLWGLHAGADLVRERRRPVMGSVADAQRRLLGSANLVVSCPAEAEAITCDIGPIGCPDSPSGVPVPWDTVAHPIDFPVGSWRPVAGRVVVPGRIESRKNQLTALALARRFHDLEFLFVGALNRADRRYGARFVEQVEATPNASHVEHLPKDEFYPLLQTAQVVLSASWFEVTSLIELFCVANRIPLAVSHHSYLSGDGPIHRFDPADLDAAAAALSVALNTPRPDRSGPSAAPVVEDAASVSTSIVDVVDRLLAPVVP